ncbi:MAG: 50S ribosomal protein L35 [Candidatus Pacebacteria bacterium]|nr:50S ribosomal protein L35 [Candidatus Paceibacterota bacterium]
MSIKTNKSLTKRLKVTRKGKVLARAPGFNHFNSKQSRRRQLNGKKMTEFAISTKNARTYLANVK